MKVSSFPFEGAARFRTFREDDVVWRSEFEGWAREEYEALRGAYVKLVPPPGATAEQVASLRAAVEANGAVAVRVMPIARQAAPVLAVQEGPRETLREAAMQVAREVASGDRPALIARVEKTLAKAGA